MIKVENIDYWGFEHAIRGMRNPLNSWNKSDSEFDLQYYDDDGNLYTSVIGDNDLELMRRLYKAGTEHRKYLRQIFVSMDITAPLYWWKEFDTYKIGTVANSCSTMHKIAAKEFELDDFSCEHLKNFDGYENKALFYEWFIDTVGKLNVARRLFLSTGDKQYWWQLIQLIPSSYNQRRTVTMNYENAITMIRQRTGHKLDEWNDFVKILTTLPYVEEIVG